MICGSDATIAGAIFAWNVGCGRAAATTVELLTIIDDGDDDADADDVDTIIIFGLPDLTGTSLTNGRCGIGNDDVVVVANDAAHVTVDDAAAAAAALLAIIAPPIGAGLNVPVGSFCISTIFAVPMPPDFMIWIFG